MHSATVRLIVGFKSATAVVGYNGISHVPTATRHKVVNIPRPTEPSRLPDAVELYLAGESVLALAKRFKIGRDAVRGHLLREGITLRTASEQNRATAQREGAAARMARVTAAHATKRGRSPKESSLARAAATRERRGSAQSEGERRLLRWLEERGQVVGIQTAVKRYNVDFTIETVAVELLGGEWHQRKRRHGTRTKTILDAGWNVLFVWDTPTYPVEPSAADYAVAFAKKARRNPSSVREYLRSRPHTSGA
jgi:very-short-patch-repair endonuclease